MQKKIIVSIITFILIIVALGICLIIGYRIGTNGSMPELVWEKPIDVKTIAIVNLDEGVAEDGKIVNYSNELIEYSNDYLVNTSLEDARMGIENGTYAAYVIVPATFSENVNSINATPLESQIQYELCNKLSSQAGLEAMSNIYILINNLNDNISYMYVDSILDEFHDVQDGAEEILENDKTAQSVINGVVPEDISANVEIPSEEQMDYSPQSVDYSTYLSDNATLITDINNTYSEGFAKSKEDKESLISVATTLSENLSATNKKIKNVNVELDDKGNYVYDAELKSLRTSLDEYNEELKTNMGELQAAASSTTGLLAESKTSLDNITHYYSDTVDWYDGELSNSLSTLATVLSSGSYQLNITNDKIAHTVSNGAAVAGSVDITYPVGDKKTYLLAKADGSIDVNVLYTLMTDLVANGGALYTFTLSETTKDVTSISELMETVPRFDKEVFYQKNEDGSYSKQDKNLKSQMGDVTQKLTQLQTTLKVFEEEIPTIDTETIANDVKVNVVDKLSENAKSVTGTITSEYENGVTTLSSFDDKLTAYDPFSYINQKVIGEKKEQLNQSTGMLQTAIQNKDSDDIEMMNSIYEQYGKNISSLKDSITTAVESSNASVEEGLKEAKAILNTNSSRNQELLVSFGNKLPYTRNGKLGNYRAYQFIVNPCESEDLSNQVVEVKPIIKEEEGVNELQEKQMVYAIAVITLLALITSVVVAIVYKKRTAKNYNL